MAKSRPEIGLNARESRLETAVRDLLAVISTDDLIPESVSYIRQAREALALPGVSKEPPHHCRPSDYVAMIVRLQFIESGEYSPSDFDWRTQAGVLWRMLEYATRPTDASVDAFLGQYARQPERTGS